MFQALSNELLVERFGKLVRTERKISHLVIACIAEIETRKIHLDRAYPNLFEYLTKEFGYSESAAYRRISAARLLRQVPEMAQKIEAGKINLSQASLLVQSVRAAEKSSKHVVSNAQKLQILDKIEEQSFQHSQRIIQSQLGVAVTASDKTKHHADGSVTISLTLNPEQAARWRQVGELASHAVEAQNPADLLDYLVQKEIARRTEIRRKSPIRKSPSQNPRAIAPNVRKKVLHHSTCTSDSANSLAQQHPVKFPLAQTIQRQNHRVQAPLEQTIQPGCSYQDPVTGRRCGSQQFIQVDHRRPVWAGGHREIANLQALCASHNRRKYERESRIMSPSTKSTRPQKAPSPVEHDEHWNSPQISR